MTQDEVAKALGVSRARIYELEKSAFKKIKIICKREPKMLEILDEFNLQLEEDDKQ